MTSTVMVFCEEEATRELLVEALEEAGFMTLGVAGSDEAVATLKSFAVQVLVAEWKLALGDPRLKTIEVLRQKQPGLRSVLLGPPDARELLVPGDQLLPQPVVLPDLVHAVRGTRAAAQLFSAVLAMPKKLLARAAALRRDQALPVVEQQRSRVFQGLHVAIWSKLVTPTAGLDLWDRIGELEEAWVGLQAEGGAPELLRLAQRYQELFDFMTAMAQAGTVTALRPRQAGQVDLKRMQCLFDRVKAGMVNRQQIHHAWVVWNLPPGVREENLLFRLCWDPQYSARPRKAAPVRTAPAPKPVPTPTADGLAAPVRRRGGLSAEARKDRGDLRPDLPARRAAQPVAPPTTAPPVSSSLPLGAPVAKPLPLGAPIQRESEGPPPPS